MDEDISHVHTPVLFINHPASDAMHTAGLVGNSKGAQELLSTHGQGLGSRCCELSPSCNVDPTSSSRPRSLRPELCVWVGHCLVLGLPTGGS